MYSTSGLRTEPLPNFSFISARLPREWISQSCLQVLYLISRFSEVRSRLLMSKSICSLHWTTSPEELVQHVKRVLQCSETILYYLKVKNVNSTRTRGVGECEGGSGLAPASHAEEAPVFPGFCKLLSLLHPRNLPSPQDIFTGHCRMKQNH